MDNDVCLGLWLHYAAFILSIDDIQTAAVIPRYQYGTNIRFLLRLGEVVGKHTRHLGDTFLLGSEDASVSCDDTIVTVDDNRIDEAELAEGRAEFHDLLW